MTDTTSLTADERSELDALRARVASLEGELVELQARTNKVVAAHQERLYWLDRWHLDLNALMERPGADEFRRAVRLARGPVRWVRLLKRRLLRR